MHVIFTLVDQLNNSLTKLSKIFIMNYNYDGMEPRENVKNEKEKEKEMKIFL